jgi:hypothetical protein
MAVPTSHAGTIPVATLPEGDKQVTGLEVEGYLPLFIREETQAEFGVISPNQIWDSIRNCSLHPDDPQARLRVIELFHRVRITFVESLIPISELIQWQSMREAQLQKQLTANCDTRGNSANAEMYERLRKSEAAVRILEEFNRCFDKYPEVFERLGKDLMDIVNKTQRQAKTAKSPFQAECKAGNHIDYDDSISTEGNEEDITSVIKRRFERYTLTDMVAEIEELGDEIHAMAAEQTSAM